MGKVKILLKIVITIVICFTVSVVHSQSTFIVHQSDGSSAGHFLLGNIKLLTFSEGNLSVKMLDGNDAVYALNNLAKFTFDSTDDMNEILAPAFDITMYYISADEIIVESPVDIRSLMLFGVDGKFISVEKLYKTSLQANLNVSSLRTGIYLLRIETLQGTVTKKLIKK